MKPARILHVAVFLLSLLLGGHVAADAPSDPVPACSDMDSDECVIRHGKDTLQGSEFRGQLVYRTYCILCHGAQGHGDGRAARLHTPRPFNLTQSTAPRYYVADLIRQGGAAMGRGPGMPPWSEQLTDEQINDVLNYIFTLRISK